MYADIFRKYYDYHFAENRATWDRYIIPLTAEQFTQAVGYSRGSVRDQIVHIMNTDEAWFSGLREVEPPEPFPGSSSDDRDLIRARWDVVERGMREYLDGLRDEMLLTRPWNDGEDKDLFVWQVLLHVVNHGTDHRAQALRLLHDMGVETTSQDYIFFAYEHP